MSPRAIRWVLQGMFILGIAGMIVGSIKDNNGFAITFGIVCAIAALGLILITAVVDSTAFERKAVFDDRTGELLEDQIQTLVKSGADETAVRRLVRTAVQLGASAKH